MYLKLNFEAKDEFNHIQPLGFSVCAMNCQYVSVKCVDNLKENIHIKDAQKTLYKILTTIYM